jgi:serine protease AprX
VPRDHYTVRLDPDQARTLRDELDFVTDVRLYGPQDTGPITFVDAQTGAFRPPGVDRAMLTFDLRLHRDEDQAAVQGRLENMGVAIAGTGRWKIRIYLPEDSEFASDIAAFPEVAEMSQYVPPTLHDDEARTLLGINKRRYFGMVTNLSQTGKGQIVAVADGGLDASHPDFHGRIVGTVPWGRPADTSDPDGHGTHVAGCVLGDGASSSASGSSIRGTAPEAKLFFQSLLDANGELGGLPDKLERLFDQAYNRDARIHSLAARTA